MTDREQLCREFTELTGGHWHDPDSERNIYHPYMCSCGRTYGDFDHLISHCIDENPTYENPTDILKVMMERKYCDDFLYVISCGAYIDPSYHCIGIEYIVEEDKLLKTAVEFLIERKK